MEKPLKEILLSVVVCTYGRVWYLPAVLASLIDQTLDKECFEIIIVNNRPSQDITPVVNNFSKGNSLSNIHVVQETREGLGIARNSSLHHTRGKYVAFIDDDAKADRNWLKRAINLFKQLDGTTLAIGGPILPFYQTAKPNWFKDAYERRSWGDTPRYLQSGETFSGSNMIFRKEALIQSGGFNENIGMKGDTLMVGEETKLFQTMWKNAASPRIFFYSPSLIVFHLVPLFKMTPGYHLKRSLISGWSKATVSTANPIVRLLSFLTVLVGLILFIFISLPLFITYRHINNWLVEKISVVYYLIGYLAGIVHIPIMVKTQKIIERT